MKSILKLFIATLFIHSTFGSEVDYVLMPLDHNDVNSVKIKGEYLFKDGFDSRKKTVVVMSDGLDRCFTNHFQQLGFSDKYNVVYFLGRSGSDEISRLVNYNGQTNWSNAYKWLNLDQQAKDLELFRNEVLGGENFHLFSYPSASGIALHYLSVFPNQVSKVLAINPLLFDLQKNMNFRPFEIAISEFSQDFINEKWMKFAWYMGREKPLYEGKIERNDILSKIYQFNLWGFLIPDVPEVKSLSLAVKVRLFEHSRNYLYDFDESKPTPKVVKWMKKSSKEVWDAFDRQPSRFIGMHYDLLTRFTGEMMIVCSSQNLIINPKTFEGLAEFIQNPTMLYINDAHALQKFYGQAEWPLVIQSFFDNDVQGKIQAFKNLQTKGLIH
ncbi:hypothetical protein Belba_0221 [Belliella baltica DSM 15883]|uniref:Alpha/beta hydrolase n=1 Tax=Belliella baltica (strain DSM 15883 / CIP 108006 / LMG 21964 / BA134) TaxID=866536 RepID=I3Z0X1_BELBD|nr:hypothetical protein [Belliella baltica]AFL82889.1 hypothetical protein Belba_0221 [Belliella baltica DSM 15883]